MADPLPLIPVAALNTALQVVIWGAIIMIFYCFAKMIMSFGGGAGKVAGAAGGGAKKAWNWGKNKLEDAAKKKEEKEANAVQVQETTDRNLESQYQDINKDLAKDNVSELNKEKDVAARLRKINAEFVPRIDSLALEADKTAQARGQASVAGKTSVLAPKDIYDRLNLMLQQIHSVLIGSISELKNDLNVEKKDVIRNQRKRTIDKKVGQDVKNIERELQQLDNTLSNDLGAKQTKIMFSGSSNAVKALRQKITNTKALGQTILSELQTILTKDDNALNTLYATSGSSTKKLEDDLVAAEKATGVMIKSAKNLEPGLKIRQHLMKEFVPKCTAAQQLAEQLVTLKTKELNLEQQEEIAVNKIKNDFATLQADLVAIRQSISHIP